MTALVSRPLTSLARRISLRAALMLDAVVTAANGAAYLLAAEPLGDLLGLSPALLRVLGAGLIAYAAAVLLIATRPAIAPRAAFAVVAVNIAWALASIATVLSGWASPATAGALWIVAQAIVVALFAELQVAALRR